jgi:LysM repeat protein
VAQSTTLSKHKIVANETFTSISVKYKTSVKAILEANPEAKNGIKIGGILLIPANKKEDAKVQKGALPKTHEVLVKETKYSISKLYSISIEDLENANPVIVTNGLQTGQILQLTVPKTKSAAPSIKNQLPSTVIYHVIAEQETKYSVSKKYNITVASLEQQNPEILNNFPIGYKLVIDSKFRPIINSSPKVTNVSTDKSDTKQSNVKNDGSIPDNKYQDLSQSLSQNVKKELVLFLPFNVNKIETDTVNSIGERLKKDKFLNLTLDFYSGALMAIDSAKVLNLNLNVRIYDSEETKNSTSANQIVSGSNFKDADVIIGPFYQSNIEKVAESLSDKNTFLISPLSKENGKSFKNLMQSMPTTDATKNVMFDYMRAKNGNIITIVDPKKVSIKQYLDSNQPDVKRVNLNDKGVFSADSIKKHFVKDRINYVVMESERTGVIFTTTTTMSNALKDYQLQLVILEPNETLDFDEIALSRLTKLKMMYPSTTYQNESDAARQFERSYKKKNKIYPNQYAVRGFDLVFDTMLRLSQLASFEDTINQNATQQIENKFDYSAKPVGGYANNGISILYYDTDLKIKQAQ